MPEQQEARPERFRFEIPESGELEFRVVKFTAMEQISVPYKVVLNLASEDDVDLEEVVGKSGLLTILSEDTDRLFHGIISEFTLAGRSGRFNLYRLNLVPSIWLLSLENDCRIFQEKTVPEIVQSILEEQQITSDQFAFRLQKDYQPRTYCVQYRETDLNFISRLLEEEGIFYFFEHTEDTHLLVFGDGTVNYQPISGESEIEFHHEDSMIPSEEFISAFTLSRRIRPGKFSHTDFNFEQPSVNLMAEEESDSFKMLEIYDYPGEYREQKRGKALAKIRLEETSLLQEKAMGKGACARFLPGFTFSLTGHEFDGFNQEYLLIDVMHAGSQAQVLEERRGEGTIRYSNEYVAIPSTVAFRPERDTPKPSVEGVQTAIISGPDGEEIYTDEYGRVKAQFHWDRVGGRDENSSCWIRVASTFAGGNYGAIFTPRIGQEVLVNFVDGDPDRPIITGSVYNADHMPPYVLPDEKTKSTVKTNSSIGGEGFNEIRFEDKKGEEQLFIHAEKNQDLRVKNTSYETIGKDRNLTVGNDQKEEVGNNRNEKVGADHIEAIGKDRHLKVSGKEAKAVDGSHSFTVKGDVIEVFKKNHSEQTTNDYYVKADNLVIEGMTNVTVKVGQSYVAIESGGIKIGTTGQIVLDAMNTVDVKGMAGVTVESPAQAEVKSAMTTVKGDGMVTIQGGLVKIN